MIQLIKQMIRLDIRGNEKLSAEFDSLNRIVTNLPLKSLHYPYDVNQLPEVITTVIDHIQAN